MQMTKEMRLFIRLLALLVMGWCGFLEADLRIDTLPAQLTPHDLALLPIAEMLICFMFWVLVASVIAEIHCRKWEARLAEAAKTAEPTT